MAHLPMLKKLAIVNMATLTKSTLLFGPTLTSAFLCAKTIVILLILLLLSIPVGGSA